MVLDLGTVEGAFTGEHFIGNTDAVKTVEKGCFSLIPHGVFTDSHCRARCNLKGDVFKAEGVIDLTHDAGKFHAFRENLIFRAEDVTVVLREASHTHHAVKRPRGFVAVALTEFTQAHRKIAVASQIRIKDLDVARAVHGL